MTTTISPTKPPAFIEEVDQSFTEPTGLTCAINGEGAAYFAQIYTAGIDGRLAGVSINVRSLRSLVPKESLNFYRLHVAICAVRDGFPSAVLTETLLETDEAQLDTVIRFPDDVAQVAGTQYAIVVHYADAPPAGARQTIGNWFGATHDHYPKGEVCYGPDGRTWFISSLNNHDAHFCTYVIPA